MTDQQNSTPKSPADAVNAAYSSIANALGDLQDKFQIPDGAREFVKRTTATAQERVANMRDGATEVTSAIEGAVITAVTGIAEANRKVVETAHEDAVAALAAIDKIASAQSLADAYQVQVDYWRERGEVGATRAKDLAAFVTGKLSEGVKTVQEGVAKVAPFSRKAA